MERELVKEWLEAYARQGFARSSGPGGQNVNKVNTAVVLHACIGEIAGLNDGERELLRQKLAGRINNDDELVIQVQDSRSQWHNRQLALERALVLVERALHRDKPRRATKPSRASKERRVAAKKIASNHKKNRGRPGEE